MADNCVFCKIIKGELPSKVIYEDEECKVILDIAPATKGHALVLPKEHYDDLYAITEEAAGKAFMLARRLAVRMTEKLGCDGFNILQNNGEVAGQTVQHFHLHLIPRYVGDGQSLLWNPGSPDMEALDELRDLLLS